ncbi:MAG: cytochrome b/b6 domain-containing protein [Pseudomonadota bacterium]|nr:cytochrome b/b6 domain-containing protein [Pseudomonadota bacterium]
MTVKHLSAGSDAAPTHPKPVIVGHWVSAYLLLLVFALVLSRELIDDKTARTLLLQAHRVAGLLVGGLAIFRLGMRSRLPLAEPATGLALWQRRVSRLTQVLMYLMLLSLPVLGWLLTNARGQPVALPLMGSLPVLMERDLDLADTLELVHTYAAWGLVTLVALHAAAAVWHHRVRRDGVLMAMWPGLRPRT